MAELSGKTGQAGTAESKGSTAPASTKAKEQSASTTQTTDTGTAKTTASGSESGDAESFFDPKSIDHSPELKAAYKQMQGKWTKEMQKVREGQKKIESYDSIIQDPLGAMHKYAQQMGYQLVQRDPNAKDNGEAPKTWNDVYAKAKQEVLNELKPLLGEVQQLKQANVEQYLDNHYTDWRTYEDDMLSNLREHPSLAHDPDKLYRVSVPEEVYEARATKAALAKLKGANANGQISGTSTATKDTTDEPPKGGSFNDYVAYAKAKLAREGIKPLGG